MTAAARAAALLAALTAFAALPLVAQGQPYSGSGAPGADAYADSRLASRPDSNTDSRESYSYVRAIEGSASLASYGNGPGEEATLNQILQQGDRVRVEHGGRLEIYLADRNLVRVGGDSDLGLTRIAFSADRDDRDGRITRLDLDRGEILLVVTEDALGDELPEIHTASASIYINEPGTYRIRADEDAYTELVVREGYGELLTEGGSTVVRAGEEAWTSGDSRQPVEIADAGPRNALERWGEELTDRAEYARERVPYVEPELSYAAAPLADYGSWVSVDSSWYWRPRVSIGWRPYWQGRWSWSPSGFTWVSSEPWGWVPYHYGTWCNLPGYGWSWRPGYVYSPAWVYWYASDSWTGWCPIGYYTNYYPSYWNFGFRFGVYGWCGGSWSLYSNWNFCNTVRLCDRRWGGNWSTCEQVARQTNGINPNGILTTDTRGLPRDRWDRPGELVRTLERNGRAGRRGGDLPEVTDFVARKKDLPPTVSSAIRPDPTERPGRRHGTPLDPTGLGNVGNGGPAGRGRSDVAHDERPGWRGGPKSGIVPNDRRGNGQPDLRGYAPRDARPEPGARSRSVDAPAPAPSDRQGWKSGGGAPGTSRTLPPAGTRWQQPSESGRGNPVGNGRSATPAPRDSGRPREVAPPARGSSGDTYERTRPTPPPAHGNSSPPATRGTLTNPRYGYPARDLGATPPAPQERGRGYAPPSRSGEPVERVIGGVRRSGESLPPSRSTPPGGWSQPPSWGTGPGQSAAPRAWSQPSGPSGAPPSARSASPSPRISAPAPSQPSSSSRAAPPQRGGAQSGGQKSNHPPQSSKSPSSPPPERKPPHNRSS